MRERIDGGAHRGHKAPGVEGADQQLEKSTGMLLKGDKVRSQDYRYEMTAEIETPGPNP